MDPPPHETLVLALEQLYALGALNHLGELTKVRPAQHLCAVPLAGPGGKSEAQTPSDIHAAWCSQGLPFSAIPRVQGGGVEHFTREEMCFPFPAWDDDTK